MRHAQASTVAVSLRHIDDETVLEVRDDGRGLPARVRQGGLAGMRERAMLIGAVLEVQSGGGGTAVMLRIPDDETPPVA
jgi:two-component system sensor histidine kinase UhpB